MMLRPILPIPSVTSIIRFLCGLCPAVCGLWLCTLVAVAVHVVAEPNTSI